MDLRDLHYFELVADIGHIGRAAEAAHRTQPAITKSIQRIEAELDAQLFDRKGHRLTLTPAGNVLLVRARQVRQTVEDTRREVRDAATGTVGHVRLGVSTTAAEFLLPELATVLLQEFPGITLKIELGMNDFLAAALKQGALDLAVGPFTAGEPELAFQKILTEHVVVVASRKHPLFLESSVKMADLQAYRWVLPSRSAATRSWLEHAFESRGLFRPVAQIESNSISLTPRLVSGTILLSFITRRNLRMERLDREVREIELPETTMPRQFGILTRTDGYLSPAAQSVRRILQEQGAAMSADVATKREGRRRASPSMSRARS